MASNAAPTWVCCLPVHGPFQHSVSVVVPVLNEEDGVGVILRDLARLRPAWLHELIFVDGGSVDRTLEMLERAHRTGAERWGLRPALRQHGPGLASAWREGLGVATGEAVVSMDGDGAHRLKDVPLLLESLAGADIVVASRYGRVGRGMQGRRLTERFASRAAAFAWSVRHGLSLRDPLHGFRARTSCVVHALRGALSQVQGNVWLGCELVSARNRGFRVAEVDIAYGSRLGGEENKQLPLEGVRFARALLRGVA